MAVIEVAGAQKAYRRGRGPSERALDGLDLLVEEGGVHGFLGPNGSGKTTTIRCLLGLVRADAGELRLLGRPVPEELPQVVGGVGALVETPLFFPAFSGRLNLRVLAETAGVPRARVEECLELVGLRDRADDAFKGYSLGMKQRLGIAAALLKRPRLLILDEPSNGLDPAGIREVRELVRRLGADGHSTVFLSSHLLAEVQQVCDHVSILARGRLVASGPVGEVLASRSTGDVRLRAPDPVAARAVLERAGYAVASLGDAWRVSGVPEPSVLTRLLAQEGQYVSELTPISADLESVFLELTGTGAEGQR
ncbi:ABC transporter ATP-binding protein [Vallicoccus soli]|uniref:ABC transporter ATP-binding protein n=1 Tax=Vallicoccus soli TaxID=2339232 RepID=A0A3A3YWX7_9ACTN|nr:ABC transporter ATP-binding protein [Vallicoccus soli]RJK95295.1 ABC transporter ATP-binding protein [Vallicoccus soli]